MSKSHSLPAIKRVIRLHSLIVSVKIEGRKLRRYILLKYIISLLLALFLYTPLFGQDIMKIGYFYLEPFIIEKKGAVNPIGVSVDYWEKYIAPKMGVNIKWVGPLPIARMYYYLDTGEIDAVFICVKNPDREKKYLFPSRPYCMGHASLWVLKESPLETLTDVSQLNGWRIGFVQGSVVNPFLSQGNIMLENAQGEDYKTINFSKLFVGRLDAIYDHNEYTLAYEAVRRGFRQKLRVIFLPLEPAQYFSAFANTERGVTFLHLYEPVNNALSPDDIKSIIKVYTDK